MRPPTADFAKTRRSALRKKLPSYFAKSSSRQAAVMPTGYQPKQLKLPLDETSVAGQRDHNKLA